VKLFAFGHDRDARGSAALAAGNLMLQAIHAVKRANPAIALTTEVCGCSWTDNGECVLRSPDGAIDLDATYQYMGQMALQHGDAGADVVSPTAMLDSSVHAVRSALDGHGLRDIGVNPNLALHTTLYAPFNALMATEPRPAARGGPC
jgi:porphobilinogen synthase